MLVSEWSLRPPEIPFDPYSTYSQLPTVFSLEIHHGGVLSKKPNRVYQNGKVSWFDKIDSDGFYVVEVLSMLACLGYKNQKMKFWYRIPNKDLDRGLVPLRNDSDVLKFNKYVDRFKLMRLYVLHPIDEPQPVDLEQNVGDDFDPFLCDLELLWRSATSPTIQLFDKNMDELRQLNKDVYDWLKKIPAHHWARSHFSGRPKCDVLLKNMCEVINRQLLDGRDKPIITCLEFIRQYLMKRIVKVQEVINKSNRPLTPNATIIFYHIKKEVAQCNVDWNGGDLYKVAGPHGYTFVCNMNLRVCACRKWELTGIPCKHAVASIWNMAANGLKPGLPETWVSECYWLTTWEQMYSFKINPCNGPNMWKKSPSPITLTPPDYHTPVGRPTKKRKKSAAELYDGLVKKGRLSRAGKSVTCCKCGELGHNSRTCKGQRGPASQGSASASVMTPQPTQGSASASVRTPQPTQGSTSAAVRTPQPTHVPSQSSASAAVRTPQPTHVPSQGSANAAASRPQPNPVPSQGSVRYTKGTASRFSPLKKK